MRVTGRTGKKAIVRMTRTEWNRIGKRAGWSTTAQADGTGGGLNFRCPKRGRTILEEVITGATVSTPIEGIDEEGYSEYGDAATDDGEVDRYQCANCGAVVLDERTGKVTTPEALVEWLKKNGML